MGNLVKRSLQLPSADMDLADSGELVLSDIFPYLTSSRKTATTPHPGPVPPLTTGCTAEKPCPSGVTNGRLTLECEDHQFQIRPNNNFKTGEWLVDQGFGPACRPALEQQLTLMAIEGAHDWAAPSTRWHAGEALYRDPAD